MRAAVGESMAKAMEAETAAGGARSTRATATAKVGSPGSDDAPTGSVSGAGRSACKVGNPILRETAYPVPADKLGDPMVVKAIDDLVETMRTTSCFGLSAPQIGVPARIVAMEIDERTAKEYVRDAHAAMNGVPEVRETLAKSERTMVAVRNRIDCRPVPLTVIVNPEIVEQSEERVKLREWCLSVPNMSGVVERPASVVVRGLRPDGTRGEFVAAGFPARVLQHEIDHLDGVLFTDKMDTRTLSHEDEPASFNLFA